MNNIRHKEGQRDSLYKDFEQNLETIYALWTKGKLKVDHWNILGGLSLQHGAGARCNVPLPYTAARHDTGGYLYFIFSTS